MTTLVFLVTLVGVATAANKPLLRDNDYLDVILHPSWRFFSMDSCGLSNQGRIIGGHEPDLGAYPWIVRLGYTDVYTEGIPLPEFFCGGTLISERYVLTAAHCILEVTSQLTFVRLGEHNARTNPDCMDDICAPPIQDIDVEEIFSYIAYAVPKNKHDIALLRLQRMPNMNDYVRPICLPFAHLMSKDYIGTNASVAGWGITNIVRRKSSTILLTVNVPIVPINNCSQNHNHSVDDLQICAGGIIHEDSCNGDSGGPLMVVDLTDWGPAYFLYGVVSYGPRDCANKENEPAVYTRTAAYLPWILDHMRP